MKENNNIGESSNGRTPDFDSEDVGSNPASPSIKRREYMREYQKNWYKKNRQKVIAKSNNDLKEIKRWFAEEIIAKSSCKNCGFNHPGALDFHHRNPSEKEGVITEMVANKRSKKAILKEIEKCDVLCANCHRILHWNERNSN